MRAYASHLALLVLRISSRGYSVTGVGGTFSAPAHFSPMPPDMGDNGMHRLLVVLAATSMLTGAAYAQTTAPAPTQPSTPAAPPAGQAATVQVPQDAILSGQIDDLDLRNAANEAVGEIEDAIVSQGRIVGYVISVGGFLGVADRNVVVEPSAIAINYNTGNNRWEARINATKEQLQAAPEFKYEGRWDDD
jgi:hypothetical protein